MICDNCKIKTTVLWIDKDIALCNKCSDNNFMKSSVNFNGKIIEDEGKSFYTEEWYNYGEDNPDAVDITNTIFILKEYS